HMGYRLKGKRPIEVLLDKTTCPKRLTYDKIDTPTNVEVSTHLPTCTRKLDAYGWRLSPPSRQPAEPDTGLAKARSERPSERDSVVRQPIGG
ncbi:MAG: hypothetical protein KKA59_06030, partial [Candidatus Omnitrophica bacterium]|nr:hypothetical protein [Candidatus Omnitrophota bacterium]